MAAGQVTQIVGLCDDSWCFTPIGSRVGIAASTGRMRRVARGAAGVQHHSPGCLEPRHAITCWPALICQCPARLQHGLPKPSDMLMTSPSARTLW
jgi:hypothetical protein